MTDLELAQVIDVAKDLWGWEPTTEQEHVWTRTLGAYEYTETRRAVQDVYAELTRPQRQPVLKQIKMKAVTYGAARYRRGLVGAYDPALAYSMVCLVHKREAKIGKMLSFYVAKRLQLPTDPDLISNTALKQAEKLAYIYGGVWTRLLPEDYRQPRENDGLSGEEAKQKAEELILLGDDCPAKRFLINRQEQKKTTAPIRDTTPYSKLDDTQKLRRLTDIHRARLAAVCKPAKNIVDTDEIPF